MNSFLGKKLLFVVAHPDDESFTAGGTMWQNHMRGGKNYIVCATLGERGKSHIKKPVTQNQLKKIRKQELKQVAKFLKVSGLYFFNFPDTELNKHVNSFTTKTAKLVKKINPDYILSFGPDGMSGHLDHIAAGAVGKKLAKQFKLPFIAFGASPALRNQFKKLAARRKHGKYAKKVKHLLPNLKIKVDYKQKLTALKFHKSQAGPSTIFANMPKDIKNGFMDYEYFVV